VVEGRLTSVREIGGKISGHDLGGMISMNFGRRRSQALTVTILKRHERSLASAGPQPGRRPNRRLRVRGSMGERSGSRIVATRPAQIEIAGGK
jgi:hypothetical protein